MPLIILSFLAGILSVLAPCVLPVLPIILGSSIGTQKRYRPLVIVLSTGFFITFFTIVLKASSLLIGVPQGFRVTFSAIIIIVYGLTLVWPELWEKIMILTGLSNANTLATKAKSYKGTRGDILLGAALGPIFASCSPTYGLLLSIVFPKSFGLGVLYTIVYSIGFSLLLLVIAYGGRAVVQKLMGAANPRGRFKRALGVLLILTGVLIATGRIQALQTRILSNEKWDITKIEQRLINFTSIGKKKNAACFTSASGVYTCSGSASQLSGSTSAASTDPRAKLLNANYAAPEFAGLENWINSQGYSSIHELSGKVVLIDFRTYSCINCIRTLPYIEKLYENYKDKGLIVIGVHAPEFAFEHELANVQDAVKKFGLTYPVVQDNDFSTWRNYDNLYWPAKYIIDRQGNVRYTHFGEGEYEQTEQAIQYLLGLNEKGVIQDNEETEAYRRTPETYLGASRRANFSKVATDELDGRWISGNWETEDERLALVSGAGSISINAQAKEVNLVLGVDTEAVNADIYVDGKKTKTILIDKYQLYNLATFDAFGTHKVEIRFEAPGVMAYAYTFG